MTQETRVVETDQFRATVGNYVTVGDHLMPSFVEVVFFNFDEPDSWVRIELRDNIPRIVEVGWRSAPTAREIKSKDVRALDFTDLIAVFYTAAVRDGRGADRSPDQDADFERVVRGILEERRTGKRRITGEFLQQVAAVYRANIDHAPTEAVARTFGVKHRQAGGYVKEARKRGLLPDTNQGKAKA